MGFFGEQGRMQGPSIFFEEFSREKYILEEISHRVPSEKSFGLDIKKEFYNETHYTTGEYSALLLLIWSLFSKTMLVVNQKELDRIETSRNYKERELKQLFFKYKIEHNLYLREQGIYEQKFEGIRNMCH